MEEIGSRGFVDVKMLQLFLHFIESEVEGINCVALILVVLWNVVQLFMCGHFADVVIQCISHVIFGGDNNPIRCFQLTNFVSYYSSIINI